MFVALSLLAVSSSSSSFSAREHNEHSQEQIAEGLFGLGVGQRGLAALLEASTDYVFTANFPA